MFLNRISKPAQKVLISHHIFKSHLPNSSWQPGLLMMQWKRNQHMAGWMLDQKLVTFLVFEMIVRLSSVLNDICKLMS